MKDREERSYMETIKSHQLAILAEEKKGDRLKDNVNKLIALQVRAYIKHVTSALLKMIKVTPLYEKEALMRFRGVDWEIPYQLGRLNGAYTVMVELAKEMADEEEVNEARLAAPKYFDQIIEYLRGKEKDTQGNIAKVLGISASNLSNILKRMTESGTIYREVSGKFHYYRLTPIGLMYSRRMEDRVNDLIRECSANEKQENVSLAEEYKLKVEFPGNEVLIIQNKPIREKELRFCFNNEPVFDRK